MGYCDVLAIYYEGHTIADLWPNTDGWQPEQLKWLAKELKAMGLKQTMLKYSTNDVVV